MSLPPQYKNKVATGLCHWCEDPVPPSKPREDGRGVKPRRFCDAACSQQWWNDHRDKTRVRTGNPPGRPRQPGHGKRFWAYGLLEDDVEALRMSQDYGCAICERPLSESETVDHCHASNQVRGLLCTTCNSGLGFYKDNPEWLRRAAAYLERNRGA